MTNQTEAILRDAVPLAYQYNHPTELDPEPFGSLPLTQADKDAGYTETPLYPASAILDAVQAERAAIAVWLRAGAGTDTTTLARSMRALFLRGLHAYADAIERGEHLPQDTPQ